MLASLLVRMLLAVLLAGMLAEAGREAMASWCARSGSLDALRRAERWDPSNPEWPARYARTVAAEDPDADPPEATTAFERAVELGPHRAENWAALGQTLDLAGDAAGATRAYKRALEDFPRSPEINWEYANFLMREGDAEKAAEPLRAAIAGDPALRTGAFDLAWRGGIPGERILEMLPARQDVLSAYLDYLDATGRLDAAAGAWKRLLERPEPFDLDAAERYFDALLYAHRVEELEPVWAALARHDPERVHWQPGGAERISNGGFEEDAPNGGFGWRFAPVEGAEAAIDSEVSHEGARSLAVHFDGMRNVDFGHVVEYARVEPDTAYEFTAYTRCEAITTDSGPRIAVYDAYDHAALWVETENLTGTTRWERAALDFRTGPATRLIVVQVVRAPSKKLDNQIGGTMWLDDVSLTAAR
ncbi:MAG TPA: tetratricopeptide repeat protein [Candidatus Acidoferrales bacterium]|nr:tetratricopeptide repeat protein [Candidatus Acidoferrales bacterium]